MNKSSWIIFAAVVCFLLSGCYAPEQQFASRYVYFPPSEPSVVTVMTYNIRTNTMLDGLNNWHFRKKIVVDKLASNKADVIGLQEVKSSQLDQIRWDMTQYSFYAAGRNDGFSSGESCPIFYRTDRFMLIDSGTFWFSKTDNIPGSKGWGNILPRICSWVHLRQPGESTGFYVYNLHLDHLSQNSRQKSVRLLAKKVAHRKTSDPFIVMGDFNMELSNPAMQYLMHYGYDSQYPKMKNAWLSANLTSSDSSTRKRFGGRFGGSKIDHISMSQHVKALEVNIDDTRVDGKHASDHFPVIAKLQITPSQQASSQQASVHQVSVPQTSMPQTPVPQDSKYVSSFNW